MIHTQLFFKILKKKRARYSNIASENPGGVFYSDKEALSRKRFRVPPRPPGQYKNYKKCPLPLEAI